MQKTQNFINRIMAYFDTSNVEEDDIVDDIYEEVPQLEAPKRDVVKPVSKKEERPVSMPNSAVHAPTQRREEAHYGRSAQAHTETTTIDIKFPKKYEEARDIVNLLLQEVSVLIDFQHMTDSQARRCIDYLDGARFVLNGNLKKISSTMWLLTPENVVVNIEDMGLRGESQDPQYDYDMKRR